MVPLLGPTELLNVDEAGELATILNFPDAAVLEPAGLPSEEAAETMPVLLEAEPTVEKDVIPEFLTSGDEVDDKK